MKYEVRLPVFEGPLDLLLHLLDREEIDIWDIPIAHITDQYLSYLESMQELDLAVGGEFLVMAATLMQLKVRTLLPAASSAEEAEEDFSPIEELAIRLLEYRGFKEIAAALSERFQHWSRVFFRPRAERNLTVHYERPVGDATAADLQQCLQELIAARYEAVRIRQVRRRDLSIKERVGELLLQLRRSGSVYFSALLPEQPSRRELVITFLAVLELVRQGMARAAQHGQFSDICLTLSDAGDREEGTW